MVRAGARPRDFEVDAGPVPPGTVAALHFEVRASWPAVPSSSSSTSPASPTTWPPKWPQPAGQGLPRVDHRRAQLHLDLQLLGTDGDHNTAGLKATAMRLVNAVPAVVAAAPGCCTALDLPLITGRGLLR